MRQHGGHAGCYPCLRCNAPWIAAIFQLRRHCVYSLHPTGADAEGGREGSTLLGLHPGGGGQGADPGFWQLAGGGGGGGGGVSIDVGLGL